MASLTHRSRRVITLIPAVLLAALVAFPAGVWADTSSSPSNIVQVINTQNNTTQFSGHAQLNEITGSTVTPINEAFAYSSCTGCRSYAIAIQVDLYSKTATDVEPQNGALSINYLCTGCTTVAKAYQYVIPVDDPTVVPGGVHGLINAINTVLTALDNQPNVSPDTILRLMDSLLSAFPQFLPYLHQHGSLQG